MSVKIRSLHVYYNLLTTSRNEIRNHAQTEYFLFMNEKITVPSSGDEHKH